MTSHLQQEILEQPETLRHLIAQERERIRQVAKAIRDYNPRFIMLAARGSSDNAARYGQYLFGTINRLPVALATPSLFTLYEKPPRMAESLVIAISQSGQSPDIVAVVEEGRRQGAMTVAITNDVESPLAQAAAHTICLHTGPERSVAATKTYTSSLVAIAMLSAAIDENEDCLHAIETVPDLITRVTGDTDKIIRASERYRYMDACVVVSRGYNYATAYEIALKLKELTYILAEPYSTADFQHGPLALVAHGFPVMVIVPQNTLVDEVTDFVDELKQRGAELLIISAHQPALDLAQTALPLPSNIPEWLSPVVAVVPGQLFALGLTRAKGYDIDQPRNIHKVTRTE
ncbi:MAG: glucosamine--fructose-6-phosphate aminotransferase [Anaerolineaceae bacterium]|nr:glucosamine--fructose-6-phosphate aminotransferase [Anaerolineaceae bacterium]